MKSHLSFRAGIAILALSLCLSGLTALGQTAECIDNCLGALDECNGRTGGSTECEDAYTACVENCLSEGG